MNPVPVVCGLTSLVGAFAMTLPISGLLGEGHATVPHTIGTDTPLFSGTYAVMDRNITKNECIAAGFPAAFTIEFSEHRFSIPGPNMEGWIAGNKMFGQRTATFDFNPAFNCELKMSYELEGAIVGVDKLLVEVTSRGALAGGKLHGCIMATTALGGEPIATLPCETKQTLLIERVK